MPRCTRYIGGTCPNADKDIRDQISQEIQNNSKFCSNPTYDCSVPRIEGYEYCIRHILRDPRGAYRQCAYSYSNGRKCPNAVLKHDTKKDPALTTLCFEHSRQAQLQKTHTTVGRLKRADTNEALLHSLAHHLNIEEPPERTLSAACGEQDEEIDVVSPHVAPFVNHDQIHGIDSVAATMRKRRRILDYASDSSSLEDEPAYMTQAAARFNEYNESDDSVDSQDEDYLKHAGIYTRQEAIRISEAKLTKLQGLYIDQINRLNHTLKERRRRYLISIRKEREMLCSIHDQVKETPQERQLYEQLKALNTYHHRHGVEAVLHKKFKEKRTRALEGYGQKVASFIKCMFTEGGVKCGDRALPCSKYCRKHILEDKKQTLFRACQVEKSGVVCQDPIPCIFDDSTCVLHLVIPAQRQYIQKKYESETEEEEAEIKTETSEGSAAAAVKTNPETDLTGHAAMYAANCNVTIAHESKET